MFNTDSFSFGKNMIWFVGVVESRMDPNFLGRVKVRCFGYHSENRIELPTEDLPWAMVMQSINSGAQPDVGHSPTGLVDGTWVIGIFLDGEEAQQPLVLGSMGGYAVKPEKLNRTDGEDFMKYGFKDVRDDSNLQKRSFPQPPLSVNRRRGDDLGVNIVEDEFVSRYPRIPDRNHPTTPKLARGIEDLSIFYDPETSLTSTFGSTNRAVKEPLLSKELNRNRNISTAKTSYKYDQPKSPYNAIYPFNQVWQTESGHVLEFDDTPHAERIHEFHRSGTFREIYPDGMLVQQTMNDKYDFTEAHSFEYVKGSKNSTYRRGYSLMINSARMAGENYEVKVCGSSNYNLLAEDGNINYKALTGQISFTTASLSSVATNEMTQVTPNLQTLVGNHFHGIQNDYTGDARGLYSVSGGSVKITSAMNSSLGAGDNITINAGHTVSVVAENTFTMLPFFAPEPVGISVAARHGHIELNAQDGDTRISARPQGFLTSLSPDSGSFTVTSALPTSIASNFQRQPAPEFEQHFTHPASLVGQTSTGYVYFRSLRGNIVLETLTFNSIKFKATPVGTVETYGGYIQTISTSNHIFSYSRMNTYINAGLGLYTTSKIGTQIFSGQEIFARATTFADISAGIGGSIHADTPVGIRIGDRAAFQPAIKAGDFTAAFFKHRHFTPMGPTSSAGEGLAFDPSVLVDIMRSYCVKTFVF